MVLEKMFTSFTQEKVEMGRSTTSRAVTQGCVGGLDSFSQKTQKDIFSHRKHRKIDCTFGLVC